ncbi:MAG: hypothetical protein BGN84_03070 [Afipia sp. 62-7]|nr:hypothetical protein [Afipia sp.]OJU21864.1 MAG: hypothetical protein BGN84_03070 [Afipia sp. 62-7]
MKKVTLLAAAAAVTALATSPVLAQDSMQPRAATHAKSYKANKHAMHSSRAMHRHHARAAYRTDEMASRDNWNSRDTWHERDTGFWPADVVGGAVGAAGAIATTAVGTAGAIATAPFGGPRYGNSPYYADNGYPYGNRHRYGASYASADYGPDYGYAGGYQYNGVAIPMSGNFDARNGFTCRPGSITRIGNEQVICQ